MIIGSILYLGSFNFKAVKLFIYYQQNDRDETQVHTWWISKFKQIMSSFLFKKTIAFHSRSIKLASYRALAFQLLQAFEDSLTERALRVWVASKFHMSKEIPFSVLSETNCLGEGGSHLIQTIICIIFCIWFSYLIKNICDKLWDKGILLFLSKQFSVFHNKIDICKKQR